MRAPSYFLCILLSATPTLAQVRSLEIHKPRLFGYYIGDLISDEIDVIVDDGAILKDSVSSRARPAELLAHAQGDLDRRGAGPGRRDAPHSEAHLSNLLRSARAALA